MIVIGNGVVVDPKVLLAEIDGLAERGVDVSRLLISGDAHLIMPHHRALDRVVERYLGSARIGTTGRGIGPAYGDKVARMGIRLQDLLDPGILRKKLELVLREKNQILFKVYNRKAIDVEAIVEEYLGVRGAAAAVHRRDPGDALGRPGPGRDGAAGGRPGHHARHGPRHLPVRDLVQPDGRWRLRRRGHPADRDHPGHRRSARRTPPGSAPARSRPSCSTTTAQHLRKVGHEYGTTTGRERRCGWFDAVVARYACRLNGVTDLVITKLDVLTGLPKVPICVGYEINGERFDDMPMTQTDFHHAKPIYEELRRLVGGHHQGAHRGRAAGERPPLHRPHRGNQRHPGQRGRRRPRPRRKRGPPPTPPLTRPPPTSAPPRLGDQEVCVMRVLVFDVNLLITS